MAIKDDLVREVGLNLIRAAATRLPGDVVDALRKAYEGEPSHSGKRVIEAILENVEIARGSGLSICQDTGVPLYFIKYGTRCEAHCDIERPLTEAVEVATKTVPLRENVIHPLTKRNPGTNTGWGAPIFHYEVLPGERYLEIMAIPKGFGAEIRANLGWVFTSEDMKPAVAKCVLDTVTDSMGEPCPPVIIGVGVGGTADRAMENAKRALFRSPLSARHPDPDIAAFEEELLASVNSLGIGPMGLGGTTYALAVNMEVCGSHTAVVPVSVVFQCWASRYSVARIFHDGRVEYITHPEVA